MSATAAPASGAETAEHLRLFRRRRLGDWDPVAAEVGAALLRFTPEKAEHA